MTQKLANKINLSEEQLLEIATDAYVYFYPLLNMEITRRQCVNVDAGIKPGFGPMNQFTHMRAYPEADFKTVVRPNFDTLYSVAWLDLNAEPQVVSVPDTLGRFYLLPLIDMWTDVFAVPGARSTGTAPHKFIVTGPSWSGDIPSGLKQIKATTPYIWIVGRTKTDGPADYAAVHALQDSFEISALSTWLDGEKSAPQAVKTDASVDMKTPPLEQVNAMSAAQYFGLAASLLKVIPPHLSDWSIISRMENIGIKCGEEFNFDSLEPAVKKALDRSTSAALQLLKSKQSIMGRVSNGWLMATDTMGVYGNHYLKRAFVTMVGLGANPPEEAIYPMCLADSDGKPLDGANKYVLQFEASDLPPVNAFWSVTMYDRDGFQAANELNRFAISSWMPLKKNADGSLDLYIQDENPGTDKESNWLPAPKGNLGVTMRLYAPRPAALNNDWNPPAIKRVN